jgi:hypothetical protein
VTNTEREKTLGGAVLRHLGWGSRVGLEGWYGNIKPHPALSVQMFTLIFSHCRGLVGESFAAILEKRAILFNLAISNSSSDGTNNPRKSCYARLYVAIDCSALVCCVTLPDSSPVE